MSSWDEISTMILPQRHQILFQEKMKYNTKSYVILTKKNPRILLRAWNIWIASAQKKMDDESFHLENILFKA